MKILIAFLIICFSILKSNCLLADMPYQPFSFIIKSEKDTYYEGEKILFHLIIKNTDKSKSFPLLIPGANSGKKIVYLRILDPATNTTIVRDIEKTDIYMNIKHISSDYIKYLAPQEEVSIPIILFDYKNYMTQLQSHHSFSRPLFVGNYLFQACYNPQSIKLADSIYNFMSNSEQAQSKNKINFMGVELSNTCKISIIKNKLGAIEIDGRQYNCIDRDKAKNYLYYRGDIADTNLTHIAYSRNIELNNEEIRSKYHKSNYQVDGKYNQFEWNKLSDNSIEWINRNPNGNIIKYTLSNDKFCPKEYFSREFDLADENKLIKQVDRMPNMDIKEIYYDSKSNIIKELYYSKKDLILTETNYIYKDNKLINKTSKKTAYKIPCEMLIEELAK